MFSKEEELVAFLKAKEINQCTVAEMNSSKDYLFAQKTGYSKEQIENLDREGRRIRLQRVENRF